MRRSKLDQLRPDLRARAELQAAAEMSAARARIEASGVTV
jgi:outer membrane murein-binding lipoprotein Lpp